MSEIVRERTEGRVSYHESVEEMVKRIREDGLSNAFDRWAAQEKIRCKFCFGHRYGGCNGNGRKLLTA